MTDLKYEHECGYIEGREEGRADERKKVAAELAAKDARIRELEKALAQKS